MPTYPAPTPDYVGPVYRDSGTGNKPIIRIVIHCTVGSDAKGATGTAAYFRSSAAKGSAHYITDANLTLQSAYDSVVCWHAPPNPHSLGIEMCCSLSNQGKGHWTQANHIAMMKRTARLTAELCLHYGIPATKLTVAQVRAGQKGICGHIDVSNAFGQSSHWDPGPYFPWTTFIGMVRGEVAAIVAGSNPPVKDWFDMATEAQLYTQSYKADYQYGIDFWINGTGSALIKQISAISAATLANGRAIAALAAQVAAEDVADDNEFRAAVAKINAADAAMAAALEELAASADLPKA